MSALFAMAAAVAFGGVVAALSTGTVQIAECAAQRIMDVVVGGRPRRGPCVSATSIGDAAAARPEVNRSRKSYRSDIGPAATVNRESKQDKLEVAPRFAADPGMPGRVLVRSRSGVWFPEGAWVSNAFLGRAEAGYLRLPPKLRQALETKGVRIVLVNDLRETSVAAPAGSITPRRNPDNDAWSVTADGRILVTSRALWQGPPSGSVYRAIGRMVGRVLPDDGWQDAYNRDVPAGSIRLTFEETFAFSFAPPLDRVMQSLPNLHRYFTTRNYE